MKKDILKILAKGFVMTSATLLAMAEAFYFAYNINFFSGTLSLVMFFGFSITAIDIAYILVVRDIMRLLDKQKISIDNP